MLVGKPKGVADLMQRGRMAPRGGEIPTVVHRASEILIFENVGADIGPRSIILLRTDANLGFRHISHLYEL